MPLKISEHGPYFPIEIFPARNSVPAGLLDQAPQPEKGQGLLDTGATFTAVDTSIILKFNLKPTGNMRQIVSGNDVTQRSTYVVRIAFPSLQCGIDNVEVVGVNAQKYNGLIAIIGNDVLRNFILNYNGPENSFSLTKPKRPQ